LDQLQPAIAAADYGSFRQAVFRDGVVLRGTERREYQRYLITFDETARLFNRSWRHVSVVERDQLDLATI
jgi:hypothetical protein